MKRIFIILFYNTYYPLRNALRRLWLGAGRGLLFCWAILVALRYRYARKPVDVGLGPLPMINNVYHKKALERYGYSARTFTVDVFSITDQFDFIARRHLRSWWSKKFLYASMFRYAVKNFRCLYMYFDGGILGWHAPAWKYEAWLYRLARVKTVIMPYGGDIQDFTRSTNLLFKNAMSSDYPKHRFSRQRISRKIDQWTLNADHIISGCDWVEYLYHWDTLMLAHFSIDTERWKPVEIVPPELQGENRPLRILHAPNHRHQKGSKHFIRAVEELKAEGLNIELVIVQKVPNEEIRRMIGTVDLVADQLIIGWYAMFSLEAMSLGKPVLCYLRKEFEELYIGHGLVEAGEIPIINSNPFTVKERIREWYHRRNELPELGRRSREFVLKHHSLDHVGGVFDRINRSIGVQPPKNV